MKKHKLLSFLLAVLAAVLLWVYAVTVVNPDDKISIRGVTVRITGASELQMNQLILTGGESQRVDVEIAGRRSDLKELNSDTLEAIADVSRIDAPGTYEVSWTLDPPSTVASGDIKLIGSSSNKIKVKVSEYRENSQVPLQIEYQGALAEGFIRDPAVTNLEFVTVSGPAEEVDKISAAKIVMNLSDTKSSLDREMSYDLIDEDGERLQMSSYVTIHNPIVRVMVPVYCYKQIKFELELIPGGGADIGDAVCVIEPSVIGLVGDEEVLKEIPSTWILRTIKLADIKDELTTTIVPELPEGVKVRGQESEVSISVKLENLTTRTIYVPCSNIVRENDNGEWAFEPERIPITVRGKTAVVHGLNSDMIFLTADMENDFDQNEMTVRLTVSLKDGIKAGVLGKYSVPVIPATEDSSHDETTSDR